MEVKQSEIGRKVRASIQKSGRNPALFKSLIMTAIYALELLINRVFKVGIKKPEKALETVAKAESEQTVIKAVKPFIKVESEPIPEVPKKSVLASKFHRLESIHQKLDGQNKAIYEKEQQLKTMEQKLSEVKGMFKGKERKQL